MNKNSVIAVVGPTGSGKTKLAIDIAKNVNILGDFVSAEVICCDSRQIYLDMDIATAKPTKEETSIIKHNLYDFVSPERNDYSVAVYVKEAKAKIEELLSENKLPIIVGGTGLYFKSLLGEFDIPKVAPNYELREKLNQKSSEDLHNLLKEKDFELSEKIHQNNKNKIVRALEVIETLGIPMSQAQKKKETPYNVIWTGLDSKKRDFLYERINLRCEKMLEQGLIEELKQLLNKYGDIDLIKATIGYKEFLPYLNNEISYEEAKDKFKQHTRNYAKRQLSWFRADKNINWFYIDEMSEEQILESIIKLCS